MHIERLQSDALVENRLPDGSRVIVDPTNETVFAMNATAGAAWDACSNPTTLSSVANEMRRSLNPAITDELAEEALLQLHDKKLVNVSSSLPASRRQFLASLSAVALPLVVALTITDQKAHALVARSTAPKPAPPAPPKPPKHLPFL
jgi:hypothetical protein